MIDDPVAVYDILEVVLCATAVICSASSGQPSSARLGSFELLFFGLKKKAAIARGMTALRFSLIAHVPPVLRGSSPAGHDQPACRQALSTTQARPREAQAQVTDDTEPARSRAQSKNRGDDHYNCSGGHDPSCNPTYASQNSLNSEFPHNVFV
jgi:hypothetical protein